MERFDQKGMMLFPNPIKRDFLSAPKVVVFSSCCCPQGHNLISSRASFNGYPGILLGARKKDGSQGLVALSPIFGEKSRITWDIDLKADERVELFCPHCSTPLPVLSPCPCGGDLRALFTTHQRNFSDSLSVCDRVNCFNAELKESGKHIALSMMENL